MQLRHANTRKTVLRGAPCNDISTIYQKQTRTQAQRSKRISHLAAYTLVARYLTHNMYCKHKSSLARQEGASTYQPVYPRSLSPVRASTWNLHGPPFPPPRRLTYNLTTAITHTFGSERNMIEHLHPSSKADPPSRKIMPFSTLEACLETPPPHTSIQSK